MRADADFMVYVAARWPTLVKEAVLLGCPPEEAPEAATDALSRCRRGWERSRRDDDVDQLVRRELVTAVGRRPRTPEGTRQEVANELLVLAPPTLDDVRHRERVHQRRGLRRAAAYVVPLVLLGAGAAVYYSTSGGETPPREQEGPLEHVATVREENPAPGLVWYAEGRLHLEHTVLEVDGVRDMTKIGNGVVYGDDEGRVVYAADDGSRVLLGYKDPDVPVAATDETGLAAWYDPGTRKVVVVEASTGDVRLATGVGDEPEVVAVDGDVVYLVSDTGARALLPTGPASEIPVSPAGLLDVRSRIRAFQKDPQSIQVVQSAFDAAFTLPGRGAELSPDGNLVATHAPLDDEVPLLYDTRSGAALDLGLSGGDRVLALAPGSRDVVAYVVQRDDVELRTCVLDDAVECTVVAEISDADPAPVLAR
jgi:hypothetical protein